VVASPASIHVFSSSLPCAVGMMSCTSQGSVGARVIWISHLKPEYPPKCGLSILIIYAWDALSMRPLQHLQHLAKAARCGLRTASDLPGKFFEPSIRLRFDCYVQLVAIKRNWVPVLNLQPAKWGWSWLCKWLHELRLLPPVCARNTHPISLIISQVYT